MQRYALAGLFAILALGLAAIGVASVLEGGRAVVIGIAAVALGLWLADLARRAWPRH